MSLNKKSVVFVIGVIDFNHKLNTLMVRYAYFMSMVGLISFTCKNSICL
jgi:hypothetical protein